MKKTVRPFAVFTALLLLLSMLSVPAFAAISVTQGPVDAEAVAGEEITFSVVATGDELTYQWYVTLGEDFEPWPLDGDFEGISGFNTPNLTVEAFCGMDSFGFFCDVTDSAGNHAYTQLVTGYVSHNVTNYIFNEYEHYGYCTYCDDYTDSGFHTMSGDACTVCDYDLEHSAVTAPVVLDYEGDSVQRGEDALLSVDAIGLELTYQWYYEDEDGEHLIPGATQPTLLLENVLCEEQAEIWSYFCTVSNSAGSDYAYCYLEVLHNTANPFTKDAFMHTRYCDCGEAVEQDFHIDLNNDRKCDDCGYALHPSAPKITGHPADAYIENGDDAVYSVEATGAAEYYWYYVDGGLLEDNDYWNGSATDTLTVISVYPGEYDCLYNGDSFYSVVSNEYGALRSATATYNVEHADGELYGDEWIHWKECVCGVTYGDGFHYDQNGDHLCDLCEADFVNPFKDVTDPDVWFYDAAIHGAANGYFVGDLGYFKPADPITRGQVVTVLARYLFGEDMISGMSDEEFESMLASLQEESGLEHLPELTDLDGWYYERHARLLTAIGIVTGYEDNTFGGNRQITRQELSVLFARFIRHLYGDFAEDFTFGNAVPAYADAATIAPWAADDVDFCRANGLFAGDQNQNLNPYAHASRAEMATVMMRLDS